MNAKYTAIGVLILLTGCTPKEPAQKTSAPPAETSGDATTVVDRLAPMPEPLTVTTAIPAAVVADTADVDSDDVADVAADAGDEDEVMQDVAEETATADADLVFNLSDMELDVAALSERGIALHELNDVRMLAYGTNSSALIVPVSALPTGSCERTLITVVRQHKIVPSKIVEYGRAAPREHFLICVAYIPNAYILSCYQHDTAFSNAEPDRWYALAATYDGSNLTFYSNGSALQSKEGVLSTFPSASIAIGSGFDGSIAGVKIWNRALSGDEVARESAAMLQTVE